MEDRYNLRECNDDDVFSFGDATFKVGKFRRALNQSLNNDLGNQITHQLSSKGVKIPDSILYPPGENAPHARWFDKGMDCEILNLGAKNWKKGRVKIKISVEFYVEEETDTSNTEVSESESPLDDLRQRLNQENQQ
jgi:KGK domain